MLPNISDCNYFKRSALVFGDKKEPSFIFNIRGEEGYNFVFKCPKCGSQNEYLDQLNVKKIKENGKNRDFILFYCKKCNNGYRLEKQKRMMGAGKSV